MSRTSGPGFTREDSNRAYRFAVRSHDDQRYGDLSYGYHLRKVILATKELGFEGDFHRAVAALHDVVEDTPVTQSDLEARFGAEVAAAVLEITRQPDVAHDAYIQQMGPDAFAVKLGDRLANLRQMGTERQMVAKYPELLAKYRGEMPHLLSRAQQLGPQYIQAAARVSRELERAAARVAKLIANV